VTNGNQQLSPFASRGLLCTIVIGVLVRLILCDHPCGSYDIAQVFFWGTTVYERGLGGAYATISPHPSHAPGGFVLMALVAALGRTEVPFGFILRLFTTCIDVMILLLIWRALARKEPSRALVVGVLWAVMPYIIIQASFHANLDPLLGLLFLCAGLAALRSPLLSGAALASAACVKIPALLPLGVLGLCYASTDLKKTARFCLGAAVPAFALVAPGLFISNYFSVLFFRYRGIADNYGLWGMLPKSLHVPGLATVLPLMFVGITAIFAVVHIRRGSQLDAPVVILATVLPVLFASEGFGIQYYSWIVPLLPFTPRRAWPYALALVAALSALNVSLVWELLKMSNCIGPGGYRNLDFLGPVSGGDILSVLEVCLGVCVWVLCIRLWVLLMRSLRRGHIATCSPQ
jgi:hypothetical protein